MKFGTKYKKVSLIETSKSMVQEIYRCTLQYQKTGPVFSQLQILHDNVLHRIGVLSILCCPHLPAHKACLQLGINTLRPRQHGRHFADDTFKRIFLNENVWISLKISLNYAPKGPINNIPALVQIMAWRRPGDKPLSEPMVIRLPTHICVTRPQWVNNLSLFTALSATFTNKN